MNEQTSHCRNHHSCCAHGVCCFCYRVGEDVTRIDDGKPRIMDMTRSELVEELAASQRLVIERMDDHTMMHQVARIRTADYLAQLVAESECGHASSDHDASDIIGQYL